ncbi:hypothetical protein F2Q70_00039377 [Brassica cretica]|uniref:Uncharacterized protein n=1 Tax=Brassica cretica TaxID=69181 RepID=A0A8S9K7X5_BRACR|nr:hypothetical protein F2Q70_00039377 [Brassica cretica]KAF2619448.1 hypothetical protein F2Q68_00040063 [Brassica cretica]
MKVLWPMGTSRRNESEDGVVEKVWEEAQRGSLIWGKQPQRPSRPLTVAEKVYKSQKRYGGFKTFRKRVRNQVGGKSEEGKI